MNNIFSALPPNLETEVFQELLKHDTVRIERIVSKAHTSPNEGWYDQDEHEWVMVLQGAGTLLFEDGGKTTLKQGDFIHIPPHTKHKVAWTDPDEITIWLAIFYK